MIRLLAVLVILALALPTRYEFRLRPGPPPEPWTWTPPPDLRRAYLRAQVPGSTDVVSDGPDLLYTSDGTRYRATFRSTWKGVYAIQTINSTPRPE